MSENDLGLKRIHHVEYLVGNGKQASYYYRRAFGFSQLAYSGLETGNKEQTSYVLEQEKARLVLTTPLSSGGPVNELLNKHGDGVVDIAFEVEDVDAAFAEAVKRGAPPVLKPCDMSDDNGTVRRAAIGTYGDTIHSFLAIKDYQGPFLPGFEENRIEESAVGIHFIDHIVGNVELGRMDYWADFYEKVLGFHRYISFDDKDISTEFTALQSVVMASRDMTIKFPINEPAKGRKVSQIQEYIDFYNGPGAQHLALHTRDVIPTVRQLRDNGVEFLQVPDTYYEELPGRVGEIKEDIEELRQLGILVDRDDEGYLLQIFTKPVEDRPTLFYEIIQRRGARGFGKGNFKALFESIEREQARRGTL
jgi:4-hydroxyphenylpyruvate dioxygenase